MRRFGGIAFLGVLCAVLLGVASLPAHAGLNLGNLSDEWVEQQAEAPIKYFYYLMKEGSVAAEFRAVEEKVAIKINPQGYLKLVQQNSLKTAFANYAPGDTAEATVAGQKAARHDFTFTIDSGAKLKGRVYCFLKGQEGYTALFVGLEDFFDRLEPDFEAVVSGMTLGDAVVPSGVFAASPTPVPAKPTTAPLPKPSLGLPVAPTKAPAPTEAPKPEPTAAPTPAPTSAPAASGDLPTLTPEASGDAKPGKALVLPEDKSTFWSPETRQYEDPMARSVVTLPETIELKEEILPDEVIFKGPDASEIRLLFPVTEKDLANRLEEQTKEWKDHGSSPLSGALAGSITLYSKTETVRMVRLLAHYKDIQTLIAVTLAAADYDKAKPWIQKLFADVKKK